MRDTGIHHGAFCPRGIFRRIVAKFNESYPQRAPSQKQEFHQQPHSVVCLQTPSHCSVVDSIVAKGISFVATNFLILWKFRESTSNRLQELATIMSRNSSSLLTFANTAAQNQLLSTDAFRNGGSSGSNVAAPQDFQRIKCPNGRCTASLNARDMEMHKAHDCLFEPVECPFAVVGCKERMLRKDIKNHEKDASAEHNRLLLIDNMSLRILRQEVARQAETIKILLASPHRISFRVKVAELLVEGEVNKWSDYKTVGAGYSARMRVQQGYDLNADCCGVCIYLRDGPFPCRVISTVKVLNYDGNPDSTSKSKMSYTYEQPKGWGFPKMIAVSKLTAAGSPYVNNGTQHSLKYTLNASCTNLVKNSSLTFCSRICHFHRHVSYFSSGISKKSIVTNMQKQFF